MARNTLVATVLFALCLVAGVRALNVWETIQAVPALTSLETALSDYPDLIALLETAANVTIFAPNDVAFDNADLPADAVENTLTYHAIGISAEFADLADGLLLDSLYTPESLGNAAQKLKITIVNDVVLINGAGFVQANISADNGFVHIIDAVLLLPKDIVAIAAATPDLSTLVQAVTAAGLVEALQGPKLTVFAPLNSGFAALPAEILTYLLANFTGPLADLQSILKYHVLGSVVYGFEVSPTPTAVPTLNGELLTVQNTAGTVTLSVDGTTTAATVQTADVLAMNGVVHIIDNVLVPASFKFTVDKLLLGLGNNKLYRALERCSLLTALQGEGPFTVLAPDDAAFESIDIEGIPVDQLTDILLYHVLGATVRSTDLSDNQLLDSIYKPASLGGDPQVVRVTINDNGVFFQGTAQATKVDNEASNGVVHVVSAIVTAPAEDIVAIAAATPDLSTLVQAVTAAGLVEALQGPKLTVFAPLNSAFAAIYSPALEYLLSSAGTSDLATILTYHVLGSVVYGFEVSPTPTAVPTLSGESITVQRTGAAVAVSGPTVNASVALPDVIASNGVVHVVNKVLIPAAFNSEKALTAANATTLLAAIDAADLGGVLEQSVTIFAPTNTAFDAVPNLSGILDDVAQLTSILTVHVVSGLAENIDGAEYETLSADNVTLVIGQGTVSIKGTSLTANIVGFVPSGNGYIYVIDAVLVEGSSSSGLSGGAIAGIVIGSIAGAALLVAGGAYFLGKREGDDRSEPLISKV